MFRKLITSLIMLCALTSYAQRPALNSPVIRFQDNNGKPLAGGKLYTYQAGTTTALSTYKDSTTGTLNTNPVTLDSTGSATVFLGNNVYKLVLQNASGSVQWTADNIAQNAFNQGGGGGPTGAAGGDLGGTYPNPRVVKINGLAVPTSQAYVGTDASGHIIPGSAPAAFYQTLQSNATGLPQEPVLNLIPGTGTAITCVDNPGATRTDCTFNLASSTAVDYYWTEAGCVIGVGQPNHCDFTAHLPGAMPSASYQLFCTLNFLSDTPAAACNLAQATLPIVSGDPITMRIGQYQQNGTTGFTAPTIYMHAHYGSGGGGGGGGGGFPITLGTTVINANSTTSGLGGILINSVNLSASGSPGHFLDQTGAYNQVDLTTGVVGLLPHANIASTAVTAGNYTNANITVAADGSVTAAANGSSSTGLSGMTPGQVPLAATSSTVTSSMPIAGAGLGLVSGPTSAPAADIPVYTGTTGGIVDSGVTISSLAPKASPALTGTPTAPTATVGDNSTKLATTAFVLANSGGGATIAHTTNIIKGDGAGNGADSGIGAATCSGCHGVSVPASSSPVTPVSATAIYTTDSSGNAAISENGVAASRPCTIANALCGGTPGGSNTDIQFNNSGAFGGSIIHQPSTSGIVVGTDTNSLPSEHPYIDLGRNLSASGIISHALADDTVVSGAHDQPYASYDTRTEFTGAGNHDHFAGYQSIPTLDGSYTGILSRIIGLVPYATLNCTTCTVTTVEGLEIDDYTTTSSFHAGTNYGIHILPLVNATTNIAIQVDSTPSFFGGSTTFQSANTDPVIINSISTGSGTGTADVRLNNSSGVQAGAFGYANPGFSSFLGGTNFFYSAAHPFCFSVGAQCDITLNTSGQLLAAGVIDGAAPMTVTTGTSATLGGTFKSGYTLNAEATAAAGVAYTLPTASAGLQYCVGNSWNGSAATTGVLTVNASASGQFIIFTDGTLSATGGNVTSGGAAADFACFVGVDSTHWYFKPSSGAWAKH